ncbi:hypothetical protein BDF22DRAFT_290092 [Syncephalis plumigaleata]|nr:hypothetical protein BDF22DRAFT_290092 [Syncephalis plumigaleata]
MRNHVVIALICFLIGYGSSQISLFSQVYQLAVELITADNKTIIVQAFLGLSAVFAIIFLPAWHVAGIEADRTDVDYTHRSSAREQLRRRGSF